MKKYILCVNGTNQNKLLITQNLKNLNNSDLKKNLSLKYFQT